MERFREYLRHKSVFVDVWDGSSLLQIGTARVPLAALLRRQGHAETVLRGVIEEGPLLKQFRVRRLAAA